jgi:hypothetical protein
MKKKFHKKTLKKLFFSKRFYSSIFSWGTAFDGQLGLSEESKIKKKKSKSK